MFPIHRAFWSWVACVVAGWGSVRAGESIRQLEASLEAKLQERRCRTLELAGTYETRGDWKRAVAHYQRARRFCEDAAVLQRLLRVYRGAGELREQVDVCEALVRVEPRSVRWRVELGGCHFRLGDHRKAEAAWRTLAHLYPTRADGLRAVAIVFQRHGLSEQAAHLLRHAAGTGRTVVTGPAGR